MSDSGLYTQLYAQLRTYAELVDLVIVDLGNPDGPSFNKERETLANMLRVLQTKPSTELGAVLLANVLHESKLTGPMDWQKIADALDRGEASPNVIGGLEELARALESERADIHARIRGSYAR